MFQMPKTELGIDFGTSGTRIYQKGKGLILDEPTIAAIKDGELLAAGSQARAMIGRTPVRISAVRPVRGGAIADFSAAERLLAHFIRSASGARGRLFRSLRVSVCVPYGASELERRAFIEAAHSAGSAEVQLIEQPVAAVNGLSLSAESARGKLVADLGSGASSCAVVSLNGIVAHRRADGGDAMDAAIADYIRDKYKVLIGESSAEQLKRAVGTLFADAGTSADVRGRSLRDGLPVQISVTAADIAEALTPVARRIAAALCRVYEDAPPELAADIAEDGVCLTGGLSLLPGMCAFLSDATGLKVRTGGVPFSASAAGSVATQPIAASGDLRLA